MKLYLAVDAGGTKTDFLLADEQNEIARARTGTIKRMRTDDATATRNLDDALTELCRRTGASMHEVTATCVGAAGSSVALVADWIRSAFSKRVSGSLSLVGDVEIALDAAFEGKAGVVVIAGTGSNVAGRDEHGLVSTVGGWGPALSDQASGHRVGLQGLRAAFLATDEGEATTLLGAILRHWKLENRDDLVEVANRIPSPDFSQLSPVVAECARAGDGVAISVIEREAFEMAHLIRLMIARLRGSSPEPEWLPEVAFAGSMLENVPMLLTALVAVLKKDLPELRIRKQVLDPLLGALWRARSPVHHNR